MIRKLASTTLLLALAAFPAFAGGQATIRVSALDKTLVARKPVNVEFTVHDAVGQPLAQLKPVVIATCGNRRIEVLAKRTQQRGAYAAAVTFPSAGEWTITVDSRYCHNTNITKGVMVLAAR